MNSLIVRRVQAAGRDMEGGAGSLYFFIRRYPARAICVVTPSEDFINHITEELYRASTHAMYESVRVCTIARVIRSTARAR